MQQHEGSLVWEQFLARVLPDSEVRALAQKTIGIGAIGKGAGYPLLVFYSPFASGKTTMAMALRAALGIPVVEEAPQLPPKRFTIATVNWTHGVDPAAPVVPFGPAIPLDEMDSGLRWRLYEPDVQAAVLAWAFEGYASCHA